MCGRFALIAPVDQVRKAFNLMDGPIGMSAHGVGDIFKGYAARYNIAPTQPILAVAQAPSRLPGSNLPDRQACLLRWGFLPAWVKDPRDFPLIINARAETAQEKASFRAAMRHRRILIPASGFYEWRRPPKESGNKPQAYWIRPRSGGLVAFAGLMESFASADGSQLDTGAIITTAANEAFRPIHDRMPVVIEPEDFSRWLDCRTLEPRDVQALLRPPPDELFEAIPVSDRINKVANMGPDVQAPVTAVDAPPAVGTSGKSDDQLSLF
ncbi:SOS response-associated peptidase [Allorhizobium undicola]|uniref:SOS response-associated peptidase n=1 Tax=Allorhizobium undicola TaxID=78527 RepID=UPI003D35859F